MDPYRDFIDLCSLLNANGVEFLIVGGYAVTFHGAPRFTGDLDILIHQSIEHVEQASAALKEFGFRAGQGCCPLIARPVSTPSIRWHRSLSLRRTLP